MAKTSKRSAKRRHLKRVEKENKRKYLVEVDGTHGVLQIPQLHQIAQRQAEYDDETVIYFGQHEGEKLGDIPDKYLRWLFYECKLNDPKLSKYLVENIDAINKNLSNE